MQITLNYFIQVQTSGHYILQIYLSDTSQEGILKFRSTQIHAPLSHHSLLILFRKSLGQETEETKKSLGSSFNVCAVCGTQIFYVISYMALNHFRKVFGCE